MALTPQRDPSEPAEILLAEDSPAVREGLAALLASEGYRVRTAADGLAALAEFRRRRPDLLLLDAAMPGANGFAVCRGVRSSDQELPVVFLTAMDGAVDELRAFATGADDFVSKSAPEAILLARVASALRRARRNAGGDSEPPAAFAIGRCRIDAVRMKLSSDSGDSDLSLREVEMLRLFATRPGEVFSRDFLLTQFWGAGFDGGDGALSVAVSRLRAKLGADGRRLRTLPGRGYACDAEGGQAT